MHTLYIYVPHEIKNQCALAERTSQIIKICRKISLIVMQHNTCVHHIDI